MPGLSRATIWLARPLVQSVAVAGLWLIPLLIGLVAAAAAEVLAGMGVHYGQGWYYARPAPIADVCKALDTDD